MKKILFVILTGAVCFCFSCNSEKAADNSVATKNLEATNAINKAIQSGDVSKLGDQIATDAVDHGGEHGDVIGLDSIKSELTALHGMYSDMKMDVIKELADSSYVFQWIQMTGTCTVASMGMPAGTKVDMSSIEVSKFKDGKAVEHWTFMQPSDMMKMMPPGDMNHHMMTDTTKKM